MVLIVRCGINLIFTPQTYTGFIVWDNEDCLFLLFIKYIGVCKHNIMQ